MNRKAWVLFAATSAIWGSSFLFIRVAVTDMARSVVVFGRCVLGALFLVPAAAPFRHGRRSFRRTQTGLPAHRSAPAARP